MDSALFIRKRSILAAWLIVPPVLTVLLFVAARSIAIRQRVAIDQDRVLAKVIPEMETSTEEFGAFVEPYRITPKDGISVEDSVIKLINSAAESAGFSVTSINLEQNPVSPETFRITMHIKGEGSAKDLVSFLNDVKKQDGLVYEDRISIAPAGTGGSRVQVEAVLSRIYIESSGETS